MANSKITLWTILLYCITLVIAVVITGLAFGWLSTIGLESDSALIGALLGAVDAFIPLIVALLLSSINQTLGRVAIILLLIEQIGIIVYFFIGVPIDELIQTGFIISQAVIYVLALVIGISAILSNNNK